MSTSAGAGLVIAVDGPSGAGKSSASRGVARKLGLRYLDTGAMYRALTWWLLSNGIDVTDEKAVVEHAGRPVIVMVTDPDAPAVRVDGADVSRESLRTREVDRAVSLVAKLDPVRVRLIALQREIIARARRDTAGIVADGRDIGKKVAPDAPVKIYLTAEAAVRAQRSAADPARDPAATVSVTQAEQARRDALDAAQSEKAPDAVVIDSTDLEPDEVIDMILRVVVERACPQQAGCPPEPARTSQ